MHIHRKEAEMSHAIRIEKALCRLRLCGGRLSLGEYSNLVRGTVFCAKMSAVAAGRTVMTGTKPQVIM